MDLSVLFTRRGAAPTLIYTVTILNDAVSQYEYIEINGVEYRTAGVITVQKEDKVYAWIRSSSEGSPSFVSLNDEGYLSSTSTTWKDIYWSASLGNDNIIIQFAGTSASSSGNIKIYNAKYYEENYGS